jgi:predicted acylesterase/phospholipase RssA
MKNSRAKSVAFLLCGGGVWTYWQKLKKDVDYQKRIDEAISLVQKFEPRPLHGLPNNRETRGVRILAIDGGGIRGIIPAMLLGELENRISKVQGEDVHLADHFDLVCGTSTGGIIALAHAHKRLSFSDVLKIYDTGAVFDTPCGRLSAWYNFVQTSHWYSADCLEKLLQSVFDDEDLLREQGHLPKVFVVAEEGESRDPVEVLLASYDDTSGTNRQIVSSCKVWEAARATSAAPYYFPSWEMNSGESSSRHLADGGIRHNNPLMLGIEEAKKIWPSRPLDFVLSVGTGKIPARALSEQPIISQWQLVERSIAQSAEPYRQARGLGYDVERLDVSGIDCPLDNTNSKVLKAMKSRTRDWISQNSEELDRVAQRIICEAEEDQITGEAALLRVDAYRDSGYSDDAVLHASKVSNIAKVYRAIQREDRVEHSNNVRPWASWFHSLGTTLDAFRERNHQNMVITGKAPISLMLYTGLHLKHLDQVTFVNQNFQQQKWECWSLQTHQRMVDSDCRLLTPTFEDAGESGGKVVLFFSLDPRRRCTPDHVSQIEAELRGQPHSIAGVAQLTCDTNLESRLEVSPDMYRQLFDDFFAFIESATARYPNHSGFVIASAMPNPLNYMLGTLLNVQIQRSITFVEHVGGKYEISWSTLDQ